MYIYFTLNQLKLLLHLQTLKLRMEKCMNLIYIRLKYAADEW